MEFWLSCFVCIYIYQCVRKSRNRGNVCSRCCVVGPRSWAGSPSWSVPFGVSCCCLSSHTCSSYCLGSKSLCYKETQRRCRAKSETRPKRYLAPAATANPGVTPTIHNATHRRALCGRAMHCPTTTRPSKKLRDHRRFFCGTGDAACAAQPAKPTPNSEPAGTTVATGHPHLSLIHI